MGRLAEARQFEKEHEISADKRPFFHLTPRTGWMNDPNGFSYFGGSVHLFYQYYPYSTGWGDMYWGHVRTRDLIRWEYLPAAMAPDTPYESGCFSGTAIEDKNLGHVLLYTAHQNHSDGSVTEEQCVAASSDGIEYKKLFDGPVIKTEDLPSIIRSSDFRDPKLWKDENGYHAILVGMQQDSKGAVLQYDSNDLEHWNYGGMVLEGSEVYGGMQECPDLFRLGDKNILILNAMNQAEPAEDCNIHGHETYALIGSYDSKNKSFNPLSRQILDYGVDFYAPQTTVLPDGRRVLIAWMNSWENLLSPENTGWAGMMCVPREITMKNGHVCQAPVREIENYEKNTFSKELTISGKRVTVPELRGRVQDLRIHISGNGFHHFTVNLAENEQYVTCLTYDCDKNCLTLDRSRAGMPEDKIPVRYVKLPERNDELDIRILMDRFSIEVFALDGRVTISDAVFTPQDADGVSFETDGMAQVDIKDGKLIIP